ncbi:tape measure protein [Chryseobacterium aureum]|uniref:tape measure protein n=1 Tax=Chryseobacterium aureum TaxID=2497456 RepID=UPI0013DF4DD0|nr:tape measure protein [Chryseobacterium aureum]
MIRDFVNQAERIGEVGDKLTSLGQKLTAGLTLPIIGLGVASVKAYGDIQALQKGLEAVMGSSVKASAELQRLKEVAKLPGLGMEEAVKGSINLQSIGFSASNSRNILQQFGNAVATVGKGRAEFERAIYGVQQLANTQLPLGEDLNIIKDAVPQVSKLLTEAFGTSRSDDLAKMKITSKQVLDVILNGLEKLPRVSGGIKGAFENLGDSLKSNFSRVGKVLDDNLDISGLIDKLTAGIDRLVSGFEDLNPGVQKGIIVVAGLAAAIGPLLIGLGGIMSLIPTIVSGAGALVSVFGALSGPVGLTALALGTLTAGVIAYNLANETAEDRAERWSRSLSKATASAQAEVSALDQLYKKTQDTSLSINERKAAVDELQRLYPYYFKNISDEIILNGNASKSYNELRGAIVRASLARAAQDEIDKRSQQRLSEELEIRDKINKAVESYKNPQPVNISISGGTGGVGTQITRTAEEVRKQAALVVFENVKALKKLGADYDKENKALIDIINSGYSDIAKVNADGGDNFAKTINLDKAKKETEKQLAEVFSIGSIAELQQRATLLKKAIDTSVDDIVKIRKLDKFGNDTNKKGQPYFTGEVLSLDDAKNKLEQLLAQIEFLQIKPPQGLADLKVFREGFTSEINALNNAASGFNFNLGSESSNPFDNIIKNIDTLGSSIAKVEDFRSAISTNLQQMSTDVSGSINTIGDSFLSLPQKIGFGIDSSKLKQEEFTKLAENFNKDFKSLIDSSISSGLTDMFSSIGAAIGNGGDVIGAVGNGLLKMFGGFLSDMGAMLIKYGTLAIMKGTLDEIIKTGGYQAVAAGIAAIAVGAALSVAGGAIGSRAKSGMSGGSTSTGAGADYTGNTYSSNYSSGGGYGGGYGEVVFRIDGYELKGVLDRVNGKSDRLNAGN